MKDLAYYYNNRKRYEDALPKLRKKIEDIEYSLSQLRIIAYGLIVQGSPEDVKAIKDLENMRASILIQIGRIQGILGVLDAPVKEPQIKTLYAETLVDMIKYPDKERFLSDWYILRGLDEQLKQKGLQTCIWVGSTNETRR